MVYILPLVLAAKHRVFVTIILRLSFSVRLCIFHPLFLRSLTLYCYSCSPYCSNAWIFSFNPFFLQCFKAHSFASFVPLSAIFHIISYKVYSAIKPFFFGICIRSSFLLRCHICVLAATHIQNRRLLHVFMKFQSFLLLGPAALCYRKKPP